MNNKNESFAKKYKQQYPKQYFYVNEKHSILPPKKPAVLHLDSNVVMHLLRNPQNFSLQSLLKLIGRNSELELAWGYGVLELSSYDTFPVANKDRLRKHLYELSSKLNDLSKKTDDALEAFFNASKAHAANLRLNELMALKLLIMLKGRQCKHVNSVQNFREYMQWMNDEAKCSDAMMTQVALKCFLGDGDSRAFLKADTNKKTIFEKAQNAAWDLFHYRGFQKSCDNRRQKLAKSIGGDTIIWPEDSLIVDEYFVTEDKYLANIFGSFKKTFFVSNQGARTMRLQNMEIGQTKESAAIETILEEHAHKRRLSLARSLDVIRPEEINDSLERLRRDAQSLQLVSA